MPKVGSKHFPYTPKGKKAAEAYEKKVKSKGKSKFSVMIQGTLKAHLVNMIKGVTNGWSKTVELVGTGYRAEIKGTDLILAIGFSHPVVISAPSGISFAIDKSKIKISVVVIAKNEEKRIGSGRSRSHVWLCL